jgi:aspartyl-tRNA(Asn)/glutamyl-tRNA(Gln) amidotransferase subunit C
MLRDVEPNYHVYLIRRMKWLVTPRRKRLNAAGDQRKRHIKVKRNFNMKLTAEQVRRVATLAKLRISDEEVEQFSNQLSSVLENIGQLNELDTDAVEPTSHSVSLANVFRIDQTETVFAEDAWKENAPTQYLGHFKVPKIIEE